MEFNLQTAPPGADELERERERVQTALAAVIWRTKLFGGSLIIINLLLVVGVVGLWLSGVMVEMVADVNDYNLATVCAVLACMSFALYVTLLTLNCLGIIDLDNVGSIIDASTIFIIFTTFAAGAAAIFADFAAFGNTTVAAIATFFATGAVTAALFALFRTIIKLFNNKETEHHHFYQTLHTLTLCTETQRNELREVTGNDAITHYLAQLQDQGRDPVVGEYEELMATNTSPADVEPEMDALVCLETLAGAVDESQQHLIETVRNQLRQPQTILATGEQSGGNYRPIPVNKHHRKVSML